MQIDLKEYTIYFDTDFNFLDTFLKNSTYSKIFIITDENTGQFCLPVLQTLLPHLSDFDLIEIPEGEENKNIDFCIGIWRMLLDFEADRQALVINLGGGVVTDMGSFAASTYKRGIDFIQIPTTLLSQVDASVGGKTGIDIENIKNIIGTFALPKAVFINTKFLETLPERQIKSGFAEVLKHGIIEDKTYFDKLITLLNPKEITDELIYHSVKIKGKIVTEDPFEKGLRKILNYGHTIGHAVESWSLSNEKMPLLHGEAIAIGMICEAYLANQLNNLKDDELETITTHLLKLFGKYNLKQQIDTQLINMMLHDKKNIDGKINFSLPSALGSCQFNIFASMDDIKQSLDYYRNLVYQA